MSNNPVQILTAGEGRILIRKTAEELFEKIEWAYMKSSLPNDVDREQVNSLCVNVLRNRFKLKKNEMADLFLPL